MKKYSVFIHGSNFLIRLDEKIERLIFYTTRYVEAEDCALAEFKAVELIKNDKDLNQNMFNTPENPPMLYAEEIQEIESFGDINPPEVDTAFIGMIRNYIKIASANHAT